MQNKLSSSSSVLPEKKEGSFEPAQRKLKYTRNKKCLFICYRATYLFPHQQLGIVGHHSLSVEALDISHDGEFVASSSVDQTLKFWPISYFEDSNFLSSLNKTNNQRNLPSSNVVDRADFFSGLAQTFV